MGFLPFLALFLRTFLKVRGIRTACSNSMALYSLARISIDLIILLVLIIHATSSQNCKSSVSFQRCWNFLLNFFPVSNRTFLQIECNSYRRHSKRTQERSVIILPWN
jgi:hypothetical protein